MSETTEKKFQKMVREFGRRIRAEVDQAVAGKLPNVKTQAGIALWISAYLDARWFCDAEGFTSKLRVVLPDATLFGIQISREMETLLDKIWKVRKEDSSAVWYGLKVTVTPDGAVSTDLNTDPNCVVDPTWFKS
jgi:hypothetical protein